MTNAKQRAVEIYQQHIALASTDPRTFRRTVLEQLEAETGCSRAAASTHYNNAKKGHAPIEGLGRPEVPKTVRKMPAGTPKQQEVLSDEECYTVLELVPVESLVTVGRTHSFEGLGLARIKLKEMIARSPARQWKLINGLGPNSGDAYKLAFDEKIIVEYDPPVAAQ